MRRAFTAIELAVVILLITILAAMLVPALEQGRSEAISVKCLNRVRQVGMAMAIYSSNFDGYWPWGRRSVHPDHPEWPDPTASLAALYPSYASKVYLFQCPASGDRVVINSKGTDFLWCENFDVEPGLRMVEGERTRPPMPPSYFYDGGWPDGRSVPMKAAPWRVVYGDECVHGTFRDNSGRYRWLGQSNHDGGGNFLFVDGHVEWLEVTWEGKRWQPGSGAPYVPNPHGGTSGGGGAGAPRVDTNVFRAAGEQPNRMADADLAGMMWLLDGWVEF
jgi:prepilin-type processing-associated H-X9-DG protein